MQHSPEQSKSSTMLPAEHNAYGLVINPRNDDTRNTVEVQTMPPLLQHREHVELVANQSDTTSEAPVMIAGSWRRCLTKHHLNPDCPPATQVLESHHLKEHVQRHDYLLGVAQQELVDLYNQMQGSGYSVFLTDASGIVLQQVCDGSYAHSMRKAGLRVGADWSEQANGTNGIGTCIVEQRPITVHLEDHFHTDHTQLSCSAAPIRDPSGELLAVLDSSAARNANPRADMQTLGLVRNTASFIEGLYFLRLHRSDIIIHLGASPDVVPQPRNPMIAITANGRITGANERALMVLGTPNRQALFGREIQHVFDLRDCPINSASAGQIHHLRISDRGTHIFATWQAASPKQTHTIDSVSTSSQIFAAAPIHAARETGHETLNSEVETAVELLDQNIAVLLQGETGTGKDTIARALHDASRFKDGPFVAIDCCSATLDTLRCVSLENPSIDDAPNCPFGGTLFLNNVNLMPDDLQAQLVEQMHQHERAAGQQVTGFNVIAACRDDLRTQVGNQLFREDLFYRLAQYLLEIPPLREREQRDSLIEEVLDAENARQNKNLKLDQSALDMLNSYHWPGNIRELQSALRTAVTICKKTAITDACLPTTLRTPPNPQVGGQTSTVATINGNWSGLEAAEYEVLLRELRQSRWNISATAKKVNMSRNTIYRKMEKYGISPEMDTGI